MRVFNGPSAHFIVSPCSVHQMGTWICSQEGTQEDMLQLLLEGHFPVNPRPGKAWENSPAVTELMSWHVSAHAQTQTREDISGAWVGDILWMLAWMEACCEAVSAESDFGGFRNMRGTLSGGS